MIEFYTIDFSGILIFGDKCVTTSDYDVGVQVELSEPVRSLIRWYFVSNASIGANRSI